MKENEISYNGVIFAIPKHFDWDTERRCRNATNLAMRKGLLKSKPCEICGNKAIAHHEDYSKFLEVRWLCWDCHGKIHSLCRKASKNMLNSIKVKK